MVVMSAATGKPCSHPEPVPTSGPGEIDKLCQTFLLLGTQLPGIGAVCQVVDVYSSWGTVLGIKHAAGYVKTAVKKCFDTITLLTCIF